MDHQKRDNDIKIVKRMFSSIKKIGVVYNFFQLLALLLVIVSFLITGLNCDMNETVL